jgi:gamma-glutamylcyclotransferase (GGCT)/AIG2-like uncharacterized protein YtfP
MLYFAYGSNLDQEQMADRCPQARFSRFAVLPDWRLTYRGFSPLRKGAVASVISSPQKYVEGVLYEVTEEDMRLMDKFEGSPHVYERREMEVITDDGRRVEAWVYFKNQGEFGVPHEDYHSILYRFYVRYGFNTGHLEDAVREK